MNRRFFYHSEHGQWAVAASMSDYSPPEGAIELPQPPELGMIWDSELGVWGVAPPEVPTKRRIGSPREFLGLFTGHERLAFFTAKSQSVELDMWWGEASIGEFSLDHPSVAAGLSVLVKEGILTQDRADEIQNADFDALS